MARKKRKGAAAPAPRTSSAPTAAAAPNGTPAEPPAVESRRESRGSWRKWRNWRGPAFGAIVALIVAAALVAYRSDDLRRDKSGTKKPDAAAPVAMATANYVGRDACVGCHANQVAAWRGSDHDLAMQTVSEQSVLGDFANAKYAYAGITSTFSGRDGKFYVNTDGPDGKLADYEIKYTFGVRPLQQYLVELPGGRMQALSIAWDSRPKADGGQRWFHLYPGQNIKAGNWLHWTSGGQNWNFTCAECHSTNLRKGYDAKADVYRTTWSELNVSCEACHGPASIHVAWAKKEGDWQATTATKGLAIALDERKGMSWLPVGETGNAKRSVPRTSSRELDTCARCHGRAARLSDDYVHGKPPLDTHRLALIDDNLYWNDGQMREEVYNWGSFAQSRMHAQGVTCSDCHDPHSLKLRATGNGVCAQCHQPARFDAPSHTHHAAQTPGAACTACHMPTATYMVVDPRHDHSLRIPRPDLSVKLGVPNACNACHRKETPQWAADAIVKWSTEGTGRAPSGFQSFAAAFEAGNTSGPGARGALLALIDDASQPAIVRASALARLGRLLTPTMLPSVSRALNDSDAVVRLAAVEALASTDPATRQRYLARMTGDPVRGVRIEAARALVGPAATGLATEDRTRFDSAYADLVAVETYNADRPEGRVGLANLYAARGDAEAAIAEFRKAIAQDAAFVPAYANLADLYRARGVESEAESVLRSGIARVPNAAALHHALGLSMVRQKRTPDALRELGQAARLEPANARFAYVYAIALNDSGDPKQALAVLADARKRQPNDRDLLSGLALYSAKAGDRGAALGYAKKLVTLDPENPEYAQLAARIEGRTAN